MPLLRRSLSLPALLLLAFAAPATPARAAELVTLKSGRQVRCLSAQKLGDRVVCRLASGEVRWKWEQVARIEPLAIDEDDEDDAEESEQKLPGPPAAAASPPRTAVAPASPAPRAGVPSPRPAAAASGAQKALPLPAAGAGSDRSALDAVEIHAEVARLRNRSDAAGVSAAERLEISTRLNNLAVRLFELGDVSRAIDVFGDAIRQNGGNRVALANLALAYVRQGELTFAEYYLQLAERGDGEAFPDLYGILGEVYYQQNQLERALTNWNKYLELGGKDAGLQAKIARARKEAALGGGQRSYAAEQFRFFFDAEIGEELVAALNRYADEFARREAQYFSARLPEAQVVVLYAKRDYFTMTSTPDWVGGLYDGKIRIPVKPGGSLDADLEAVIRHELTHAFVQAASQGNAPTWLHEGVAQWREGKNWDPEIVQEVFARQPPLPLAQLAAPFVQMPSKDKAATAYLQSLSMVEYLADRWGMQAVPRILALLADGERVDAALRSVTALGGEEFVGAWTTWYERGN